MISKTGLRAGLASIIVAVASFAAAPVKALPITYNLDNTAVVNCSGAPHGLWTRSGGGCSEYFSITEGTLFIEENGSGDIVGTLEATAKNPPPPPGPELVAKITLSLSGWSDTWSKHKGPGDSSTADYFGTVEGMVTFFDASDTTMSNPLDGYNVVGPAGGYAFQYGQPANDKDQNEGASVWLYMERKTEFVGKGDPLFPSGTSSNHWDINLAMAVPEPATLALLGAGLVGLGVMTRRRRSV